MTEHALVVLKVGGAVCRDPNTRHAALAAASRLARERRVLIVPGGGVFADQVRVTQRDQGFSDDTAHWMAILAMDQLARIIAEELEDAQLIHLRSEVTVVHAAGKVPVLAPYSWMRAVDPLPHSWEITSDSIAAFIASAVGAEELVLLKPVEGSVDALVDRGFAASCAPGLRVRVATPATLEGATAR